MRNLTSLLRPTTLRKSFESSLQQKWRSLPLIWSAFHEFVAQRAAACDEFLIQKERQAFVSLLRKSQKSKQLQLYQENRSTCGKPGMKTRSRVVINSYRTALIVIIAKVSATGCQTLQNHSTPKNKRFRIKTNQRKRKKRKKLHCFHKF